MATFKTSKGGIIPPEGLRKAKNGKKCTRFIFAPCTAHNKKVSIILIHSFIHIAELFMTNNKRTKAYSFNAAQRAQRIGLRSECTRVGSWLPPPKKKCTTRYGQTVQRNGYCQQGIDNCKCPICNASTADHPSLQTGLLNTDRLTPFQICWLSDKRTVGRP